MLTDSLHVLNNLIHVNRKGRRPDIHDHKTRNMKNLNIQFVSLKRKTNIAITLWKLNILIPQNNRKENENSYQKL